MKLYENISKLDYKKTTNKELLTILDNCGCNFAFSYFRNDPQFVPFVFYFVTAYSFESDIMDTDTFNESLKIIEEKFGFNWSAFENRFSGNKEYKKLFESNYFCLLSFYLETQNNREFELLMNGLTLYNQMLSASVSNAIIKKDKEGTENIDYETKNNIFVHCLELNKELKLLEEKIADSKALISGIVTNNPDLKLKIKMPRIEDIKS